MKLFLWTGVLHDYTQGMMFAVAPTIEDAKNLLIKECNYIPDYDLEKKPREFKLADSEVYENEVFILWGGG